MHLLGLSRAHHDLFTLIRCATIHADPPLDLVLEQWMQPSPGYAEMVRQIKAHYHVPDQGLDQPLRVVIATRPKDARMRVLTNADKLAASLRARGLKTEVGPSGLQYMRRKDSGGWVLGCNTRGGRVQG